jgi:hypothetical protein
MKKEDFLQPDIEKILNSIEFVQRVRNLIEKYKPNGEKFTYDNNEVLSVAHALNAPFKYSKVKEFYIEEEAGDVYFTFGFTIRYDMIDFGMSIKNQKLGIFSGAPWLYFVSLINPSLKLTKPAFNSYPELSDILKEAFQIYSDFKHAVVELYN